MAERLEIRFKIAKSITIRPAVLKKIPALELFLMLKELKLTISKIGRVPSAKVSMVRAPDK